MKYSKKQPEERKKIYAIRCEIHEENAHIEKTSIRFPSAGSERMRDMNCDLCAQRTEIVSICSLSTCKRNEINEWIAKLAKQKK